MSEKTLHFHSLPDAESLQRLSGAAYVREKLALIPHCAGVYRMLDKNQKVLYVGKAKNLRKRLENYASPERCCMRIQKMISQIDRIEIIETASEAEAFLLENDLIKRLKPHYNILLKDDKTFPHILMTLKDEWPQILKHRGARKRKGAYFGPFASVTAVNETLTVLQKAFLLRTCTDSVFYNRTRPCLLHQIKRCSAPCSGLISKEDYHDLCAQAYAFMKNKSDDIQKRLTLDMENESRLMNYEKAAVLRDRIRALNQIQHQSMDLDGIEDCDVFGLFRENERACIHVFFFRASRNCGNYAYFLEAPNDESDEEIFYAFIGQFYQTHTIPKEILTHIPLTDFDAVLQGLSQKAGATVRIASNVRGARKKLTGRAALNAKDSFMRWKTSQTMRTDLLDRLQAFLNLNKPVERVEAYDNSHIQGTSAVGVMIAANRGGFDKKSYRRFNIDSTKITPGDDYAMMNEVLTRRFKRGLNENNLPDVVFIDGGKNQLAVALNVLENLNIQSVCAVGVAKGEDRNAGRETLFFKDRPPVNLDFDDPLLHYIQRLRDESHRFAVGSHRIKRKNASLRSELDEIEGIGNTRKKALLHYFGSVRAIREATTEELCRVQGISPSLAEKIKSAFEN